MSAHPPPHRVPVPLEVRTKVLRLGPKKQTCATLRISEATYDDTVDPYAMLRPETLQKVLASLEGMS
jgi:hypothetical protein